MKKKIKKCCGTCAHFGKPRAIMSYCYRIPAKYPMVGELGCCEHWIENFNLTKKKTNG